MTFTEGQPCYSMTWIHESFKVLKCKVQAAGQNAEGFGDGFFLGPVKFIWFREM